MFFKIHIIILKNIKINPHFKKGAIGSTIFFFEIKIIIFSFKIQIVV